MQQLDWLLVFFYQEIILLVGMDVMTRTQSLPQMEQYCWYKKIHNHVVWQMAKIALQAEMIHEEPTSKMLMKETVNNGRKQPMHYIL